ncbi:MAG: SDR family NAD(P)-dependent oxidoreductase [Gammaproteobacteria bacterium]|nr:SDR family NAD(P)-dependent oxidoreductase [Gammaproteobacteria bacterium]
MSTCPAITKNNVAVITGGADGIGLATANYLQSQGMLVCIADNNEEKLSIAQKELDGVLSILTDVSKLESVQALHNSVMSEYGHVDLLMNNAGTGRPNTSWDQFDAWQTTLNVNLWGVIHGIHTFVPTMVRQGNPGVIINTGSKQGITSPPGNPAYNVSKAGVKAVTEALAHDLRSIENCPVTAHLLVPGFTYTGMIRQFIADRPPGAWTPDQVVEYLIAALGRGDFYILCPDNDVDRETDNKRMAWAMGDLIENRPALSRWHPDYISEFQKFMEN